MAVQGACPKMGTNAQHMSGVVRKDTGLDIAECLVEGLTYSPK